MGEPKPLASLSSSLLARKGDARPAMRRQNMTGLSPASSPASHANGQDDLGWNDMGYDVDPPKEESQDSGNAVNPLAAAIPEVVRQQEELSEKLSGAPDVSGNTPAPEDDAQGDSSQPVTAPVPAPIAAKATDSSAEKQEEKSFGFSSLLSKKPKVTKVFQSDSDVSATSSDEDKAADTSSEIAKVRADSVPPVQESKAPHIDAVKSVKVPAKPRKSRASKSRAAFTLRLDKERHLKLRLACAVRNESAQRLVTQALDDLLADIPEITDMVDRVGSHKD